MSRITYVVASESDPECWIQCEASELDEVVGTLESEDVHDFAIWESAEFFEAMERS